MVSLKYQHYNMVTEDKVDLDTARCKHYARWHWSEEAQQIYFRAMADMFDAECQSVDSAHGVIAFMKREGRDAERIEDWRTKLFTHQHNALMFFHEAERSYEVIRAGGFHCIKHCTKTSIQNKFAEMAHKQQQIRAQQGELLNV